MTSAPTIGLVGVGIMGRPMTRNREVYLGSDGAWEALRPGWLAIDMSSIAPSTARDLAARAAAAGASRHPAARTSTRRRAR